MEYSIVAILIIFEILRSEIKTFHLDPYLLHIDWIFQKKFEEYWRIEIF